VQFYQSNGTSTVGAENVGTLVTLTTMWQRITVTTSAAGASTSRLEARLRVENSSASSVSIIFRLANAVEDTTAKAFVCAAEAVSNDPASGFGRVFPFFVEGDVPTPVDLDISFDGGNVTDVLLALRSSRGIVGSRSLADYVNSSFFHQLEGFTMYNDTASITSDASASGSTSVQFGGGYVRQTIENTGSSGTASATWGSTTVAESLRLWIVTINDASTTVSSPPAGYSLREGPDNFGVAGVTNRMYVYEKFGTSADSGAVSGTLSGSIGWSVQLIEIPGAIAIDVEGSSAAPENSTSGWTTTLNPSDTQTNYFTVFFVGISGTATFTWNSPPSGLVELTELASGSASRAYVYSRFPGSSAELTLTGTPSVAADGRVWSASYRLRDRSGLFRYLRKEITAGVEGLVGEFDVYARVKQNLPSIVNLQLRWGTSTADPAPFANAVVQHSSAAATTMAWVEVNLGRISVPQGATALTLELWAETDDVTGQGLRGDFMILVPADDAQSSVFLPADSSESWLGRELLTPPTSPGGLTAGAVSGDDMTLSGSTDAAGSPSNEGNPWSAARHVVWIRLSASMGGGSRSFVCRVRNITDSNDAVSVTIDGGVTVSTPTGAYTFPVNGSSDNITVVLQFDSVAGKRYQPQVANVGSSAQVTVHEISHFSRPTFAAAQRAVTDAEALTVRQVSSGGAILRNLDVRGGIPFWVQPGLNVLYVNPQDAPAAGYSERESVLTRSPTVSINYKPRYLT
jgi:hypothetical protein